MRDESVCGLIGNTPFVRLARAGSGRFSVYVKLEMFNPGGSAKDRAAFSMISRAIARDEVRPGGYVVESTSGNMGVALAQVCLHYGLKLIAVVDVHTSRKSIAALQSYGAIIDTVTTLDQKTGSYLPTRLRRVRQIIDNERHAYWPNQYANPDNPRGHRATMREIVAALDGRVDYMFVATSTCGTLRGCVEYAADEAPSVQFVAVDAQGSATFDGVVGRRLLPGHGIAVVPKLYSRDLTPNVIRVSDWDCVTGCRNLSRREAIFAGASAGGVMVAIERHAHKIARGANVVAILADGGTGYLDTVYSDDWVKANFGELPVVETIDEGPR